MPQRTFCRWLIHKFQLLRQDSIGRLRLALIHPRPTNPAIHGGVGYGRLSIPPWEHWALVRVGSIPKDRLKAGFMFIELLLVLAIIMFIAYKVFNLYFKKPYLNKETQRVISTQGIDTTSSQAIVDSTKKKLQDIQSQHMDDLDRRGY